MRNLRIFVTLLHKLIIFIVEVRKIRNFIIQVEEFKWAGVATLILIEKLNGGLQTTFDVVHLLYSCYYLCLGTATATIVDEMAQKHE